MWSLVGIAAGAALGLAGFVARWSPQHRSSAWALVAGVVLGEGVHLTWFVGNDQLRPAGLVELAAAASIAAMSMRRARSARFVPAIAAVAALVTLLAIRLIGTVFSAF